MKLLTNFSKFYRDGQKMSKRKKNYPDPLTIVDKYGADALR
jgi:isoleucyl-tRNA synthetase